MKVLYLSARTMAVVAALFSFLTATEVNVLAQRSRSSIQRRVDQLKRQSEQFERDNVGRKITGEVGATDRRQSRVLITEVRRDLESLQAAYNKIVIAMAAKKSSDDPQILDTVLEIKGCSSRLKHNLALPQADDDQNQTSSTLTEKRIEAPLIVLRKHIYNFVMNPLFESPAVLDVEQAKKASRDLDKVIEVSESIWKQHARKKSSN